MSSNNDSAACSSSQSQGSSGGGDDERLPTANYPIIPREDLTLGAQLGAGAYGSVYRGTWKVGSKEIPVAIKKVFMLEKEADILSKVRHRNIIEFFGVSHTNPDFFIVTEFAELGSLYDYVHKACLNEIEFDQVLIWAIQIAQGVGYLHYEAPDTIIHRDLKSKNIVLNGDLVCKLCDFGTSKNLTHSWTAPSWGGTAAWMSPEIINQKEGITIATDVWSYGVVLWEMIAREVPYKGLTEFSIYSMIAQQGVTLVIPEECPFDLSDLMKNCWKINPKDRYDMKQVLAALESMKENTEFTEQCGAFLKHKEDWKCEIDKQLKQLEERKIDYAKKMEELTKWERALKRREESQRELLEGDSPVLDSDVALWDESHVCYWIKKISAALPLNGDLLDHLVALIIHHNISGRRLLNITPKDLEYLGICSLALRAKLYRQIQNLRKENHRMKNFPTLEVSQQQLDQQKRIDKVVQPLCFSLVIHVTMYTRQSGFEFLPKFRYKIVVDTDWEDTYLNGDFPDDLRNAYSVVKDVCISLIYDDETPLFEPFRCVREPFVVADWIDSPISGSEVGVVCAISYTDRVIRPRSTCIRTKLFDFSRPQTLESKKIDLVVRASSLSSPCKNPLPNNERHLCKPSLSADSGVALSTGLQGVWRSRAANSASASEISDALTTLPPQPGQSKSPLWADIAAGIRRDSSPLLTPSPVPLINTNETASLGSCTAGSSHDSIKDNPSFLSPYAPSCLLRPTLNQFFAPESLLRDSVLVTRPTSSFHKVPADYVGKTFRHHYRQQTNAVNRKSGNNRIRRRPLPIILPPRRRIPFATSDQGELGIVTPQISAAEPSIVTPDASTVLCSPSLPTLSTAFSDLSLNGGVRTASVLEVDGDEFTKGASTSGTESVKKRRRKRRRPHKRGNISSQNQSLGHQLVPPETDRSFDKNVQYGLNDLSAKQNHEYVHGGCNKWSWKTCGREPE